MDEKKHKLIIDGNAFYEIDIECQKKKEQKKKSFQDNLIRKQRKRQRE